MNEASGTIADISGNGLTGTPSAGGLTYAQPSVPAGAYGAITVTAANATALGTSINFTRASSGGFTVNGTAGGVLEKLAEAGPSTGKFTAMAWINSSGLPASTTYRVFGTGPSGGWGLGLGNVDRVKFTTFGNTDYLSTGTYPFNGNWHHLAVTWNNGVVTTYVDGNVAALGSAATTFTDEMTTAFRIGGNANGTDYFNGRIDELKIYDTAMTASEIIAAAVPATVGDPAISGPTNVSGNSNGTSTSLVIPIQNTGATQTLTFSSATLSGADAASFSVADITPSIAPGGMGSATLVFTPSGTRTYVANLNLASNDPVTPTLVIGVSVTVMDPTAVVPASLDFGSLLYTPGAQQLGLTIHNSGGSANLQVVSAVVQGSNPSRFSVASLPAPIAAGADGSLIVAFDPGTEGGNFFDRLVVTTNDPVNPVRTVDLSASVAFTADTGTLQLANGNFNANTWYSENSTAPNGWTNSTNTDGLYGQSGPATPNLTSNAAHFKAAGGMFIQQPLANTNPGLRASALQTVTLGMDVGYRNDAATSGDIVVRVSLVDLTTNQEVAGRNIRIADTGVKAGTASNQLTSVSMLLTYDSSSFPNDPLAIRIRQSLPALPTADTYKATAIVDNVTLHFTGNYAPTAYDTWTVGAGLTPGANDAPGTDADKDGRSNFHEFAFGGNPLSTGSSGEAKALTVDTDGDAFQELILTVAVRAGAEFSGTPSMTASTDGVTYTIEGTTDLTLFTEPVTGPLATPVIPEGWPASPPSGYAYRSFRLVNSPGLSGKGFIRARASQSP
ncbi:choice-of-anchor D domain-containing protein [Luteolibacter ambystomatis]|uniref:Choice-of-anchor D domain-containing protein n=2 Tax=Luteolibacter ambystomatis TaxID=2824561 RepID=A0A975J1P3_9BACT|nr:LamG-like jellyroll fold domain-containing protein [Luteolibacter ambystomatis]QUE52398.1 choice-of-anchor D domain-containing protein [Luteolibacter ambystomatis]